MLNISYDETNEFPWQVEDTWVWGRNLGLTKENVRFFSKGAVLEQVAKWMDKTKPPKPIYDSMTEMTVLVTLQVDCNDDTYSASILDVRANVKEAIENSVNSSEDEGFCHHLADELSIGVSGVDLLCVEE